MYYTCMSPTEHCDMYLQDYVLDKSRIPDPAQWHEQAKLLCQQVANGECVLLHVAESAFKFFSLFIRDALPPLESAIQPHSPPRPPPPQWYVRYSYIITCIYMYMYM